ncbi:invasion protein CiaB [Candidatus Gracilibacteria bacterium]|nr:invasion protein CiaB [Candidatus Gracilibacteria bacterium]
MIEKKFLQDLAELHGIFEQKQSYLSGLQKGIKEVGKEQEILDSLLDALSLEKNEETRYIAYARLKNKHFEPLDIYLEKLGKSQTERDEAFVMSYKETRKMHEKLQTEILSEIEEKMLFTEFYRTILKETHTIGKLYSDLFLAWNKKLLFGINRELETRFGNNQEAILSYLQEEKLFDRGHRGEYADRSYSVLENVGDTYISQSYSTAFSQEVEVITAAYDAFIEKLENLEDEVYSQKTQYIEYYGALRQALAESDTDSLVEKWARVDTLWMDITAPLQPGHMLEYYEDKYRRAVSIESDIRIVDPSIPKSQVLQNIENMYEALYDEIGRENFPESYNYSLNNLKKVQLYVGAPIFMYGSFLCGSYSAQVVPNDDEVSKEYGKKIFAFPKFVYESQKAAPKMKLESECIDEEILKKYYSFLEKDFNHYFEVYDIETIGHEYGHSLWLKAGSEVLMNEKGYYKYIEEFKATAGGLAAYFLSGGNDYLDEDIVITHLIRSVRMMRYREVEDILPYYFECLIHLHIFFTSGLVEYKAGKINLNFKEKTFTEFKELYMSVYTQQIFTYLNTLEAGNFLLEFVEKQDEIFLPKHPKARRFVEHYFEIYKEKGNEVI